MMKRQKNQSFSEDEKVLCNRTDYVKIKERNASKNKHINMSTETQHFIQKICYRKTASIDMTRQGFINDSKIDPVNYVMKPLRAQLEKICVQPVVVKRKFSPVLPRSRYRDPVTSTERKPPCSPKSVKHVVVKRHYSPVSSPTKPREAVNSPRKTPWIPKLAKRHYSPVSSPTKPREAVNSPRKTPWIPKSVKYEVAKRHYSPVYSPTKPREAVTSTRKPPCIPKSALSCPGTRSLRTPCRVRIQNEPNPGLGVEQKKVKLVSPYKNTARAPCRKK